MRNYIKCKELLLYLIQTLHSYEFITKNESNKNYNVEIYNKYYTMDVSTIEYETDIFSMLEEINEMLM